MAGGAPVTEVGWYEYIVTYQNAVVPTDKWRNTFTFKSTAAPVPASGITGALRALAENLIHSDANLVEESCYNWARGTQPYPNGSPIWTTTLSIPGNAGANWTHLNATYEATGGEVALRIDHEFANPGKPGRMFCRNLLGELDISGAAGGKWVLVPTVANLQANLNTILTAAGVSSFFSPGTGGQVLGMVRYSPKNHMVNGTTFMTGMNVINVTTAKLNRKNKK